MSSEYALSLFTVLNDFAEKQTNPVMQLLQGEKQVEFNKKYPEKRIAISNDLIKAYYHCHESPVYSEEEHGHFHLFLKTTETGCPVWSHIAGLSIDNTGTPVGWFTVNRWVTNGELLTIRSLEKVFNQLQPDNNLRVPLKAWLNNMLGLYKDQIYQLYNKRDQYLTNLNKFNAIEDILDDHAIYELSSIPVNMLDKLSKLLRESES